MLLLLLLYRQRACSQQWVCWARLLPVSCCLFASLLAQRSDGATKRTAGPRRGDVLKTDCCDVSPDHLCSIWTRPSFLISAAAAAVATFRVCVISVHVRYADLSRSAVDLQHGHGDKFNKHTGVPATLRCYCQRNSRRFSLSPSKNSSTRNADIADIADFRSAGSHKRYVLTLHSTHIFIHLRR